MPFFLEMHATESDPEILFSPRTRSCPSLQVPRFGFQGQKAKSIYLGKVELSTSR
jgi:hypothetical protein